ncbi:MAG: hypothetical protein AAF997_24200 [Myxococcota bacterium]
MKWSGLVFVLLCAATATGCATAVPTMVGGSTTPEHRTDLGLGGAARVPLGKLKNWDTGEPNYQPDASAGGVVPMGYGRYGLTERWDLGLLVAGTMARADFRNETLLQDGSTRTALVLGLSPYGGWIAEDGARASGGRAGFEVPVAYGVEIGGVYEFWLGARASGEWVKGDFERDETNASLQSGFGIRVGPVIGMALGIRRFHALVELTAAYEHWSIGGFDSGSRLKRNGVALIPGFALRLRL